MLIADINKGYTAIQFLTEFFFPNNSKSLDKIRKVIIYILFLTIVPGTLWFFQVFLLDLSFMALVVVYSSLYS